MASGEFDDSPRLLKYLQDLAKQSEKPTSVRVLLVGRDGVGKTKSLEALGTPIGFWGHIFGRKLDDDRSHTTCPLNHVVEKEFKQVKYRLLVTDPPGEPHLAPAVQYFVSGEGTVAIVMVVAPRGSSWRVCSSG